MVYCVNAVITVVIIATACMNVVYIHLCISRSNPYVYMCIYVCTCVFVCVCVLIYLFSSLLRQVLDDPSHFTLCMVYDSGRKETCDKDYPLLARLRAGPDERVAKLYIVESDSEVGINVSAEVSGREQGKSCNY